jgi:endoglucanase
VNPLFRFALLSAGALLAASLSALADPPDDAFAANRRLGRGINLGNALEAPKEGDWGLMLEADYFRIIKQAGFASVRVPIKWSAHARTESPYEIDSNFCRRIDWVLDQAAKNDLNAIINVHHYDEIFREPETHQARLAGLWRQISKRYKERPETVYFELLNEPQGKLTDERWQEMITPLLEVIRADNPKRMIIVGPGHWNGIGSLPTLRLPERDQRLIVTFHYYSPFEFTHQGASFVKGADKWKGRTWTATAEQKNALRGDFDKAATWAMKANRPLFLGEFGAFSAAPQDSRATWTRAVCREAERLDFSWTYWEFASGFGAYDRRTQTWNTPLLDAMMGR